MKTEYKRRILLLLAMVSLAFLASCSAKKKTVEREKSETKIEQTVSTIETKEVETVKDSTVATKSISITRQENEFVDIEGDGSGTITRETEQTPTGIKETFTGVKNVTIGKNEIEEIKIDTTSIVKTEAVKTKEIQKEDSTLVVDEKKSSRKTDSTAIRMNTFVAGGIGLAIIIVIVIWYLRKKSSS